MVSESICLDILFLARGRTLTLTPNIHAPDSTRETKRSYEDAFTDSDLYRHLLTQYPMAEIDAAIRWLQYGDYLGESGASIQGPFWKELTDKGRDAADAKRLPDDDRPLLYPRRECEQHVAHGPFDWYFLSGRPVDGAVLPWPSETRGKWFRRRRRPERPCLHRHTRYAAELAHSADRQEVRRQRTARAGRPRSSQEIQALIVRRKRVRPGVTPESEALCVIWATG